MQKYSLLFLFVLASFTLSAQSNGYVPMPQTDAFWGLVFQDNSQGGIETEIPFIWHGDTTIGGEVYTKSYRIGQYHGGFRQDIPNEALFYLDINDVEHDISFDLNVQLDDTIVLDEIDYLGMGKIALPSGAPNDTFFVSQIDSVTVGQSYRKRVELNGISFGSNEFAYLSYTAGVGLHTAIAINHAYSLRCFVIGNDLLSGDPLNPYCAWTSIKENSIIDFSMMPNPASDMLLLQTNLQLHGGFVFIRNSLGQLVHSTSISTNSQTQLDISNLPAGLYFVEVTNGSVAGTQKLIVQ